MLLKILIFYFILSVFSIALVKSYFAIAPLNEAGARYEMNALPFAKIGEKAYYFGLEAITWEDAFLACLSHNAFLASFNSFTELEALTNYLTANAYSVTFWVSAKYLQEEHLLYWYGTGEVFNNTGWFDESFYYYGAEFCVTIKKKYKHYIMSSVECETKANFICEATTPQTFALAIF